MAALVVCRADLEDVLVEVELELFVGCVDAQLLEAVLLEVLESGDVENADARTRFAPEARHKVKVTPLVQTISANALKLYLL